MSAQMYQPATMTMAVPPTNMVWEAVAAPATYAAAPTYGTTTYAAAPTYSTVAAPTMMAAPTYTTMAAPTVVETIQAAPVTYAAPTVIETVQAAPMTYAAPTVVETIQAPQVTYAGTTTIAAAPVTTMAPSYVQQPVTYAAPQVMYNSPSVVEFAAPVSLTEGIPNPDQIKVQQAAYEAALAKQLQDGTATIAKETEIEKNMVKFTADKQLALVQMQIEEQRNEQMALLDEQAALRQCELKKAYVERKLQLDNQANGLQLDYQMKAVQTELAMKQYQFQQTYVNAENKLAADYNKQVAAANTGTAYAVPAGAVAQ